MSVEELVKQVLARNPSLAQMTAVWQAVSALFPQVTSLDDPMSGTMITPASIESRDVEFGYRVEVSQKYPWRGKVAPRGVNAQAEAGAARYDIDDMRLQLVESAKDAFYEYYLVGRVLAVNDESLRLLREFRRNAETRYKNGQVAQQDVPQADVELGRQQERQISLGRMRRAAVARINTFMHQPTGAPVPPPPRKWGSPSRSRMCGFSRAALSRPGQTYEPWRNASPPSGPRSGSHTRSSARTWK